MTIVLIGPPAAGKTRLGKRLAKRNGAESLRDLRAAGMTPERLRAELGV